MIFKIITVRQIIFNKIASKQSPVLFQIEKATKFKPSLSFGNSSLSGQSQIKL